MPGQAFLWPHCRFSHGKKVNVLMMATLLPFGLTIHCFFSLFHSPSCFPGSCEAWWLSSRPLLCLCHNWGCVTVIVHLHRFLSFPFLCWVGSHIMSLACGCPSLCPGDSSFLGLPSRWASILVLMPTWWLVAFVIPPFTVFSHGGRACLCAMKGAAQGLFLLKKMGPSYPNHREAISSLWKFTGHLRELPLLFGRFSFLTTLNLEEASCRLYHLEVSAFLILKARWRVLNDAFANCVTVAEILQFSVP